MRKNSAASAIEVLERVPPAAPAMNWRANEIPSPHAYRNRLLDAFPPDDLRRWEGFLELVRLNSGQVLSGPGLAAAHVFFPVDAIVSLVCLTQDGGSTEIASVGNDGVVGVNLFVGGSAASTQAVTQCAGLAYRMKASLLREEFNRSPAVRQILLRYMQALLTQSAQMAVCNRHHTVEQQLCRWLLLALDRSPTNQLSLTQEMIANALGVRRAGVTESASKLRKAGLLRCQRGKILVLDRVRLEHHACECYATVRDELAQVVPGAGAERLRADIDVHARVQLDHSRATATLPTPAVGKLAPHLVGQQARAAVNGSFYNGQTR